MDCVLCNGLMYEHRIAEPYIICINPNCQVGARNTDTLKNDNKWTTEHQDFIDNNFGGE